METTAHARWRPGMLLERLTGQNRGSGQNTSRNPNPTHTPTAVPETSRRPEAPSDVPALLADSVIQTPGIASPASEELPGPTETTPTPVADPDAASAAHVTAQFDEGANESGQGRVFIYAEGPLENVWYRTDEQKPWVTMDTFEAQGNYHPYGSRQPIALAEGQTILVRGTNKDGKHFTDRVTVKRNAQGKLWAEVTGVREIPKLSRDEVFFGSRLRSLADIAQARADWIVRFGRGRERHLGGGRIVAREGVFYEGWGCGPSDQPITCYGNGPAAADSFSKAPGSLTQRVRFWDHGTRSPYASNGGGGFRVLRRRR